MKGGISTLFTWSLRADVRNPAPHVMRGAFALFVLLSVSMAYYDALAMAGPGLRFFRAICYLNIVLITVAGVSYFVSAVTEEKDSGMLALLQLAGAPPLGIILSKSTSRLISALMLMLIQLPFTLLAVTLGGVTWLQVIAAYMTLCAWLCLVANAALLCSVVSPTSGRAMTLALGVVFLFFTTGPLLDGISKSTVTWLPPAVKSLAESGYHLQQTLSVIPRLDEVLSPAGVTSATSAQFWSSLLVSVLLVTVSTVLFNRYTRPDVPSTVMRSRPVRRVAIGRAWRQAIAWKDFLFFTGGVPSLIARSGLYVCTILGFIAFHRFRLGNWTIWLPDDPAWLCFLTVVGIVTVESIYYATGLLLHEVDSGTLGPLKLLPTTTASMMMQKGLACAVALLPGILAVAIAFGLNTPAIRRNMPVTMVIWYGFEVLLCLHLTLLFSLRTRWAALPIALFLTAASNLCTPFLFLSLTSFSTNVARTHGVSLGDLSAAIINLGWAWMFLLFPIEIEIVNSWNRAAEK